jgi:hypothetical protein
MRSDKLKNFLRAIFSQFSSCGQSNCAGDLRSALTVMRLVKVFKVTERELIMSLSALIATFLMVHPGLAGDLTTLTKGSYVPSNLNCEALGGAGSTYFDGKNLSFHYSYCKTDPLGNNTYRQTCVEAQGTELSNMTMSKLEQIPEKSILEIKLNVISPTSFSLGPHEYKLCEGS